MWPGRGEGWRESRPKSGVERGRRAEGWQRATERERSVKEGLDGSATLKGVRRSAQTRVRTFLLTDVARAGRGSHAAGVGDVACRASSGGEEEVRGAGGGRRQTVRMTRRPGGAHVVRTSLAAAITRRLLSSAGSSHVAGCCECQRRSGRVGGEVVRRWRLGRGSEHGLVAGRRASQRCVSPICIV